MYIEREIFIFYIFRAYIFIFIFIFYSILFYARSVNQLSGVLAQEYIGTYLAQVTSATQRYTWYLLYHMYVLWLNRVRYLQSHFILFFAFSAAVS